MYTGNLKATKCRGGDCCSLEPWMDVMVPSLRAVPHLSHLVGLASPQMSNLSAGGGHVVGVLGLVSPLSMGSLVLMPPAGSPP